MDFFDLKFDKFSSSITSDIKQFKVFAHENELLEDHLEKSYLIFNSLIDEKIIFNFYKQFIEKNLINLRFEEFKTIIFECVKYHDIGKISFNFQINRLNKQNFEILKEQKNFLKFHNFEDFVNELTPLHSFTSSIVFLLKNKDILNENECFLLILAYVINGHHTKLNDISSEKFFSYGLKNKDIISNTFRLIALYTNVLTLEEINNGEYKLSFFNTLQNKLSFFLKNEFNKESFLSLFYMYIYSALISADVFASNNYNQKVSEILNDVTSDKNKGKSKYNNRINENLKNKMNKTFYNVSYNACLDNFIMSDSIENIRDINDLRKLMLLESSKNLKENIGSNRIFFLNMPTGGGKTNTSMKLALDIINKQGIDRIIYAMPFINIIEQNYDIIRDNYGLTEENGEIREIYSGSETLFSHFDDESKYDVILNDDFFNYPIICTTFVSLFNSILKSNKKNKYKFSSLANSVIILDEIQSLPLNNWSSLYYIINELSKNLNIYFIIMSATLPNFNQLNLEDSHNLTYSNLSLIKNPKKYFNHYLFNRTSIDDEIKSFLLTNENHDELKNYLIRIIEKNFKNNYNKGMMVFNTINSSKMVFDILKNYSFTYNFEIDLLNSSMLPSTRKKIISKINKINEISDKRYILISTQSIEAGVDVSFDFVIRDFSIIDSIEQVRGRCNRSRELNKKFNDSHIKGHVYLIKLYNKYQNLFEYIYSNDELDTRIKCTDLLFKNSLNYDYSHICDYYNNVSELINNINDKRYENFVSNDRENIQFFNSAEFSRLLDSERGIHIINNDRKQFSIFISLDLDVMVNSVENEFLIKFNKSIFDFDFNKNTDFKKFYERYKKGFIFSINELNFIKEKGLYKDNKVLSDSVLEYYRSIYHKKNDYNHYNIIQKEFSSILYKFLINVSINSYNSILFSKIDSLEQLGFFYILEKKDIGNEETSLYSVDKGFNFNLIDDIIF